MNERGQFNRLAKSYGVQTSYVDLAGRTRQASPEALLAVLRALGSPVRSLRDLPGALRERELFLRDRVEPVRVVWDERPPMGIHRHGRCWVISAPRRTFQREGRDWGLFLPLYALRTARSAGAGDLSDLAEFARWAGRQGADWVGTLPLLGQFLDKPFDPSPYAPVSRLFWGEFWLDVGKLKGLPPGPWVDYRRQMSLKRAVLEKRAARWIPPREWLRRHPEAEGYARFRAATEERGVWRRWPERMRRGELRAGDCSERKARVHLYAQWLAERQMEELRLKAGTAGAGLYFDLPVGVHPDGYDAWKEQGIFAEGIHVGAPPDPFFTGGQDWGFRPVHPERIREQGYRYWTRSLRHSMQVASLLRIDHVMGLRRLFWIPDGFPASEGVYVRCREEEWFACLCLESHRNRCAVVGEDLGTVPAGIRRSMSRRGLARMFVVQYELRPGSRRPLRRAPPRSMAALNTHDMPPFASFWRRWKDKGALPRRAPEAAKVFLRALAAGPAQSLGVSVEDLWGERRQHNVPGTAGGMNWRRRARFSLEQFRRMEEMTRTLNEVSRLRARRAPDA